MYDFKDLAQLSDFILQLKSENEDLAQQLAEANDYIAHYEDAHR